MKTLVHISDLHMGKLDAGIIEPLRQAIETINPGLLIISGDITHRAKPQQFIRARQFLNSIVSPKFIVPGNHDLPFYNGFLRVLQPLGRFKKFISQDLEPFYLDDKIAVLGINTTKVLALTGGGKVNKRHLKAMEKQFLLVPEGRVKILVTHHPFDLPDQPIPHGLIQGAGRAMGTLQRCGVDLLLSGHLHVSHIGSTADRYNTTDYSALAIGVGSVGSMHGLFESYSFNVMAIDYPNLVITPYVWQEESLSFLPQPPLRYEKNKNGWQIKV